MSFSDETRHDILLIIVVALVILFTTGTGNVLPANPPQGPNLIPVF